MLRIASLFVCLIAANASARTTMFPRSLTIQLGQMDEAFPHNTLYSIQRMLAHEVEHGHITYFNKEQFYNNSVTLCVEGGWETLSRLQHAIENIPVEAGTSGPTIATSELGCEPREHQPVLR